MGKESQIDQFNLSGRALQKVQELVALLAEEGSGADGPPRETDFATIEELGHQAGRTLARALDEHLTPEHAKHFQQEEACPTCGAAGDATECGQTTTAANP